MSVTIVRLGSFLFALALAASAFCFEPGASAGNQDQNTMPSTAAQNSNTGMRHRAKSRRHRRRAAAPAPTAEASATPAVETTEQTDLSGTYTGTFDCPDAGVSGEDTLTITGNQFSLTSGKSGRITATTTRGYTGIAMQFGEFTIQPGVPAPVIVSLRAKKSGDRLTLTTVPGFSHVCSFTPSGGTRVARPRHKKSRAAAPAATGEPSTAEEPAAMAPPAETTTPTTPRRRRSRRRGNMNMNSNMNSNSNMSNDNTGVGNDNAMPTPTPGVQLN